MIEFYSIIQPYKVEAYLSSHSVRFATKYSLEPDGLNRFLGILSKTAFRLGHSRSMRAASNKHSPSNDCVIYSNPKSLVFIATRRV